MRGRQEREGEEGRGREREGGNREVRKFSLEGNKGGLQSKATRRDERERRYCRVKGPTCKTRHGQLPFCSTVTLECGR